jgi:hypothetical protein
MRLAGSLVWLAVATITASACVAREGDGTIAGDLDAKDCWSGGFDLEPNFFGAETYRDTMTLRLQRDSDFFTYADGVSVLLDDFPSIRGDDTHAARLGEVLRVGLPPEVTPPNTPIVADPDPPVVHLNLYLQKTCRTQNVALYAADMVQVAADGSCTAVTQDCGTTPAAGSAPTARSTITFDSLFNGDILESSKAERRIAGHFDVYLTDPREACPGGFQPPPCRGHLTGTFDYEYQRSRPYQPFP